MAETRLSEESLHEGGRVKNVLQRLEQQPPALVKGAIYYCVIFYGTFVKGAIYYRVFVWYFHEGRKRGGNTIAILIHVYIHTYMCTCVHGWFTHAFLHVCM